MGKTKIEWVKSRDGTTGMTWNPFRGCSRISPGCQNCYAERLSARGLPGMLSPTTGDPFAVRTPQGPRWTGKVELIESQLEVPLHWKRPRRIFVNSISDTFHESVPDEWIDRVFAVMALCPQHTFMVLTKRTERMRDYVSSFKPDGNGFVTRDGIEYQRSRSIMNPSRWPLPNVHLGVTCENQQRADERIPLLLHTPAAVRFVSCEPLLGPVDIRQYLRCCPDCFSSPRAHCGSTWHGSMFRINLVIPGGEAGIGARPCNVAWIRSIVQQCREAGVACFVKQLGAKPFGPERCGDCDPCLHGQPCPYLGSVSTPMEIHDHKGADPSEWPADLRVRELPEVAHA